jgi:hypothetical protein
MLSPITDDIANQNLLPAFRTVFRLIKEKYIQPGENIFAVGCCTHMQKYKLDYGKESLRMQHNPSLVVLSDHRCIRAGFRSMPGGHKEVTYRESGTGIGGLFSGDYFEWKWIEVQAEFSADVDIRKLVFIRESPLTGMHVTHRLDFKADFEEHAINIIEIVINGDTWFSFREPDGNTVYSAFLEAEKNKGRIEYTLTPFAFDPIEALKKAKELFELNLISEIEYEAKRREILARL